MRVPTFAVILLVLVPLSARAEDRILPNGVMVDIVVEAIQSYHEGEPQCGEYCTSERADREFLPDWSSSAMNADEILLTADAIVWTSTEFDIPLEVVMAAAFQESSFRYMSVGRGTECGLFQQTTRYFRWDAYEGEDGVSGRDPVYEYTVEIEGDVVSIEVPSNYSGHDPRVDVGAIGCAYLLDPYNAGWQFALKYHHYVDQVGDYDWAREYNSGPRQMEYARRHHSLREGFASFIDTRTDLYFASLEDTLEFQGKDN